MRLGICGVAVTWVAPPSRLLRRSWRASGNGWTSQFHRTRWAHHRSPGGCIRVGVEREAAPSTTPSRARANRAMGGAEVEGRSVDRDCGSPAVVCSGPSRAARGLTLLRVRRAGLSPTACAAAGGPANYPDSLVAPPRLNASEVWRTVLAGPHHKAVGRQAVTGPARQTSSLPAI